MLPAPARWLASARSSVLLLSSQSGGTPRQPVSGEVIWINGTDSAVRSRDNLCRLFQSLGLDLSFRAARVRSGHGLGSLSELRASPPRRQAVRLRQRLHDVVHTRLHGRRGLLDRESPGALHLFEPFKHLVNPTLPPGFTGERK